MNLSAVKKRPSQINPGLMRERPGDYDVQVLALLVFDAVSAVGAAAAFSTEN